MTNGGASCEACPNSARPARAAAGFFMFGRVGSCPEGAFTGGHLWMAALGGAIAMLVVMMILLDRGALEERQTKSDGEF